MRSRGTIGQRTVQYVALPLTHPAVAGFSENLWTVKLAKQSKVRGFRKNFVAIAETFKDFCLTCLPHQAY
jgi:hypothetical protein